MRRAWIADSAALRSARARLPRSLQFASNSPTRSAWSARLSARTLGSAASNPGGGFEADVGDALWSPAQAASKNTQLNADSQAAGQRIGQSPLADLLLGPL